MAAIIFILKKVYRNYQLATGKWQSKTVPGKTSKKVTY